MALLIERTNCPWANVWPITSGTVSSLRLFNRLCDAIDGFDCAPVRCMPIAQHNIHAACVIWCTRKGCFCFDLCLFVVLFIWVINHMHTRHGSAAQWTHCAVLMAQQRQQVCARVSCQRTSHDCGTGRAEHGTLLIALSTPFNWCDEWMK